MIQRLVVIGIQDHLIKLLDRDAWNGYRAQPDLGTDLNELPPKIQSLTSIHGAQISPRQWKTSQTSREYLADCRPHLPTLLCETPSESEAGSE